MKKANQSSSAHVSLQVMINLEDLKIKFKFTSPSDQTVAIVTIEDDVLSLRGFRIMKSRFQNRRNDFYRLVPPTFGAKHAFTVFCKDKQFWYDLEDKVWDEFQKRFVEDAVNQMDIK